MITRDEILYIRIGVLSDAHSVALKRYDYIEADNILERMEEMMSFLTPDVDHFLPEQHDD